MAKLFDKFVKLKNLIQQNLNILINLLYEAGARCNNIYAYVPKIRFFVKMFLLRSCKKLQLLRITLAGVKKL